MSRDTALGVCIARGMSDDDLKMTIRNTSDQPRTYAGGIFGHMTPDRDAAISVVAAALGASAEDAQRMVAGEMPKGPLRMRDGTRFVATGPLHLSVGSTPKQVETGDEEDTDENEDEDEDELLGDRELDALDAGVTHLEELSPDARRRVLQYLIDRFMRLDPQK